MILRLDLLTNKFSLRKVRIKGIEETRIKDIAFHPDFWGRSNNLALVLNNDAKLIKIDVEFEEESYKIDVESLLGEPHMLILLNDPEDRSKLVLISLTEKLNS